MPNITVVIPTIGRPALTRAIESALAQTVKPAEILVMADTHDNFALPEHPSIRLIRVGPGAGGNVARQTGIESAKSELIALLDDDDEWLPQHLENHLAMVPANKVDEKWIATSRLYAKYANGTSEIWPKRLKNADETLPQYIFRKRSVVGGVGFIQASTLLFPKKLGLAVPFDGKLRFHQDVAWLVDLAGFAETIDIYQSEAPSVIYHIGAQTVSKRISANESIAWSERLDPADRRTIGDFIVVHAIQGAKNAGSLKGMISTIAAGSKLGRPGLPALMYGVLLVVKVAATRVTRRPVSKGHDPRAAAS